MFALPDPFPPPADIDVWMLRLREDAATAETDAAACMADLSPDERARAARFHFPLTRARFAVCRATLRRILAAMTGVAAADLAFADGSHGKPMLAGGGDAPQFNLSHTEGLAVIAVSRDAAVGVDTESARRPIDALDLGGRVFTDREMADLRGCDGDARARRFFRYWTAKEAVLKATGRGLSFDPRKLEALLPEAPDRAGAFTATDPDFGADAWSLHEFDTIPGHLVALAAPRAVPSERIAVHVL